MENFWPTIKFKTWGTSPIVFCLISTVSPAWAFGSRAPQTESQLREPASEPTPCAMGYQQIAFAQAAQKIGQFANDTRQSVGGNLLFKIPEVPRSQLMAGYFRPLNSLTPLEKTRVSRLRQIYRNLNADLVSGSYRLLTLGKQLRQPFVFTPVAQVSEAIQDANRALMMRLTGLDVQLSPHMLTVLGLSAADLGYSFATGEVGVQEKLSKGLMDLIFYFPEKWAAESHQKLENESYLSMLNRDIRFYSLKKFLQKNPQIDGEEKIKAIQNNLSIHQILLSSLAEITVATDTKSQKELLLSLLEPRIFDGDFSKTPLEEMFKDLDLEKRKALGIIFKEEFRLFSLYFNQQGEILTEGVQDLIPLNSNEFVKPTIAQFQNAMNRKIFRMDALNTLQSLVYPNLEAELKAGLAPEGQEFFEEIKAEILKDPFVVKVLADFKAGKYKPEYVSFGLGYYLDKKYTVLSYLDLGYGLRNVKNPNEHLTPKDFEGPALKIITQAK